MDLDTEQRFHDLEQRYVSLKNELTATTSERDSLKYKSTSLQTSVNELRDQLAVAEKKLSDSSSEIRQRDNQIKELLLSQEELTERFRRRSDDIDRLREDLKNQSSELVSIQSRLKDSQIALSESNNKLLPVEFELNRANHEKQLLENKLQYVEEELRKKTKEERDLRVEFNTKIFEADTQVLNSKSTVADLQKQIASLSDQLSVQQEKTDSYLQKLRETESGLVSQQSSFAQEVEGLKRLAEVYKRHLEEATAKVEELETANAAMREGHALKLTRLRESIEAQFAAREAEVEAEGAAAAEMVRSLQAQVVELQQALQAKTSHVVVEEGGASVPASLSAIENFDTLGMTEMYDRIVATEKELLEERNKRREVEMYMAQIAKDMESKAPLIASQRRDYHRIVESHSRLTAKLDKLVAENTQLRESLRDAQTRTQQAVEDAKALEQHNNDLSNQLQHLLKQSLSQSLGNSGKAGVPRIEGGERSTNAGAVISDYLVTYDDVAELQLRNAQLLKVVRKLSDDQVKDSTAAALLLTDGSGAAAASSGAASSAGTESSAKGTAEALKAALIELNNMREARQRTEDMVASLIQQRDTYRAMVEETDLARTLTPSKGRPSSGGILGSPSASGVLGSPASDARAVDLQFRLTQAEDERRRLQERMSRLEEAEKLLHESLDQIRQEASSARMEAAQAGSEARFQKERAERLETALKTAQLESASSLQRRLDIEKTLLDLQHAIRARDDKVAELSESLRNANEQQRRAEIEAEVAKSSESRVLAQLGEAREELKRHASLTEYLHNIERGLQSKVEEEKEAVSRERDALARSYDSLRKQVEERALIDDQRLRCLEDDLRNAKQRLEEKVGELTSVSAELIREQCTAKAAQDRASLLERQLTIAQERLNNAQGAQIVDALAVSEYAAKELALEQSQVEVQALKQRLEVSEGHADQFRRISMANEAALKELRAKSAEAKAAMDAEVEALRGERDAAVKELNEHRNSSLNFVSELEQAREALRVALGEKADSLRELQEQLNLANQRAEQTQNQVELLKVDALRFQTTARQAHANYEHELQMHASSERELQTRTRELDAAKEALAAAQHQAAALSAECIRKEAALEEERTRLRASEAATKEQLEGLQRTNDLLHAQVQSLGVQIDRLNESRLLTAVGGTGETAEEVSAVSAATAAAVASDASSAVTVTAEEIADLRKSNGEMREVLRFLKKEKDMLAAKLSVLEVENNRHIGELHVANRSLDEARIELKRELDKRVLARSDEEFNKLMAEVTQLNLVRESNAHLRGENEELAKKVAALTAELTAAKNAAIPLEASLRKVQAEKESLDLINDQLNNDVGYWRDRLQKLVSRYNDVDPEEHRLLKAKQEETQAALNESAAALATAKKELAEALEAKDAEIGALKVNAQALEKTGNDLRDRLRNFKAAKENADAKQKEAVKALAEKEALLAAANEHQERVKADMEALKQTLATAQTEAAQARSAAAAAASAVVTAAAAGEPSAPATAAAAATETPAKPAAAATAGATTGKKKRPPQPATPAPAAAAPVATPSTEAAPTTAAVESTAVPTVTPAGVPVAEVLPAASSSSSETAPAAAAPASATTSAMDKLKEGIKAKNALARKLAAEKAAAEKAAAAASAAAANAAAADALFSESAAAPAVATEQPAASTSTTAPVEVTDVTPATKKLKRVSGTGVATAVAEPSDPTVAGHTAEPVAGTVTSIEVIGTTPEGGEQSMDVASAVTEPVPAAAVPSAAPAVSGTGNPFSAKTKRAVKTAPVAVPAAAVEEPSSSTGAEVVVEDADSQSEQPAVPVPTEAVAKSLNPLAAPFVAGSGSVGPFSTSASSTPSFGFGSGAAGSSKPLFGTSGSSPSAGLGLFGKPAGSGAGLFGSGAAAGAAPSSGGLFGSASTPATSGGLFGAASSTTTGTGLFAAASTTGATSGGLFGAGSTAAPTGLFGSKPSGASLFGGFGTTAAAASTDAAGKPAVGLFGAKPSSIPALPADASFSDKAQARAARFKAEQETKKNAPKAKVEEETVEEVVEENEEEGLADAVDEE